MKGLIVSNATPVIAFSRINRLDIFQEIVGEIMIPREVSRELYEHERADVPALKRCHWIKTKKVKAQSDVELLLPSLDKGEAEVVILSKELGAGLVIIHNPSISLAQPSLNYRVHSHPEPVCGRLIPTHVGNAQ